MEFLPRYGSACGHFLFFFIFPGRSGEAGFSAQRRVKEDGQSFAFNVVPIMYASTVPNHELT